MKIQLLKVNKQTQSNPSWYKEKKKKEKETRINQTTWASNLTDLALTNQTKQQKWTKINKDIKPNKCYTGVGTKETS